eukprot:g26431.t1
MMAWTCPACQWAKAVFRTRSRPVRQLQPPASTKRLGNTAPVSQSCPATTAAGSPPTQACRTTPSAISTVEAAGGRAQPPSPSPPPPPAPPPPLLFSAADSVSNIAYEEKHAVIVCPPPICEELEQTHLGFALIIKADNPAMRC